MKIVSMCTPSYLNYLYHFLNSARGEIVIYRINFSEKQKRIVEKEFPNVEFRDYEEDLVPREIANPLNNVFKVTYLKGIFMKKAFDEFNDKILWCDISELIIGDLNEFESKFGKNGFRINRGGKGKTKTFAAIFGLYGKKEINKYSQMCWDGKEDWFIDQISLAELNLDEIEKGDWIDFYYSESAKSWSDRGKTGSGTITEEDCNYTEEKYISYLETKKQDYREKFNSFMNKLKLPTVLVHTDEKGWCYFTSTRKIGNLLQNEFDFKYIYDADSQKQEIINSDPALVWARCSSLRHKKLLRYRPDLRNKSFTSITTGGELLDNRVSRNIANLTEAGLIVQNKEAEIVSNYYMKKSNMSKPIFYLPNGCDIDFFSPKEKDEFIVGWNGRAGTPNEREIKGYNFYKKAVEILGYKTMEVGRDKKIPFEELPEKFYDKISVMVLPSNCEGCSNTINEALAAGIPVLAYKIGYHGEVMKEGEDGIVWIERSVIDIMEKLKSLKQNPELLRALSSNARKWAEEHSWKELSKNYGKVFNEMINYTENLPKSEIEPIREESKPSFIMKQDYVKVKGLVEVNLGKLEKNGSMLWFVPGMIRKVPYYGKYKDFIDTHIKNRIIEFTN